MTSRLEILERSEPRDGWITIRAALNNQLAIPFQVHASDLEGHDEEWFMGFVGRQAESLLGQYGDARFQSSTW